MSPLRLTVLGVCWASGWWLLWRVRGLRAPCASARHSAAPVFSELTVVVPARDEEDNLVRLLASLDAQRRRAGEVIVVDDHSRDRTATVARQAGATVVSAPELPPGWIGKAWACWTGAQAASPSSTTLVFCDADVVLAPDGLERLVGEHARRGGLVSVQPYHVTERPYERLSAFFNLVGMMGVGAFTPLGDRLRPAGAFGPCLICRRQDYLAVGGHAAGSADVLDDVALGRAFSQAGLAVSCFGGRDAVAFRMYPQGLRRLIEGWTKNIASGATGATRPWALALVIAWITGCILTAGTLATGMAAGLGTATAGLGMAGVYGAYAGQLGWMLRRVGRFGWWPALAFPVPLTFFLAVFARSLVFTYGRRHVHWRGRTIALHQAPTMRGRGANGS